MTTLHFPNYHSEQANNFLYDFQLFSISKDFYLSWVTGYWFHDVHDNSNRCDEILVWDW